MKSKEEIYEHSIYGVIHIDGKSHDVARLAALKSMTEHAQSLAKEVVYDLLEDIGRERTVEETIELIKAKFKL